MLFFFNLKKGIDIVICIITISLYMSGDLIYTSTSYLKQSYKQMSSFISFPFKLPWGYWVLRNLDDNYPCPPKKKPGQQPDWPTSVWTTGVPQKDSAVPSLHNYLVNWGYNQAHCGAPPPTNLLQLSYLIFGDGFVAYMYMSYIHVNFP